MVCPHYVHSLYESAEHYFQIENNTNIIVYVFYNNEEETLLNLF